MVTAFVAVRMGVSQRIVSAQTQAMVVTEIFHVLMIQAPSAVRARPELVVNSVDVGKLPNQDVKKWVELGLRGNNVLVTHVNPSQIL